MSRALITCLPLLLLALNMGHFVAQAQEATPEATREPDGLDLPEGVELIAANLPLIGVYEHTISLEADDVLSVVAHDPTGSADPVLTLLDPTGEIVAENDNHELDTPALDALSAVIEMFEVEEAGDYTLQVANAFFETADIELFIIVSDEVSPTSLFTDEAVAATPTPAVQLQERPQIRSTGPCMASVDFITARLREAPTASAPQVASLVPGSALLITGRVRGADGHTWYRLENYLWVRADAVLAAGACGSVPTF